MRVIHVLRKPLPEGTVAANVLRHGTGAFNIDASRIGVGLEVARSEAPGALQEANERQGRWPTNVLLQHDPDCDGGCVEGCVIRALDIDTGDIWSGSAGVFGKTPEARFGNFGSDRVWRYGDTGGASRFFKQIGRKPA